MSHPEVHIKLTNADHYKLQYTQFKGVQFPQICHFLQINFICVSVFIIKILPSEIWTE